MPRDVLIGVRGNLEREWRRFIPCEKVMDTVQEH
jgi:hypothetical protein